VLTYYAARRGYAMSIVGLVVRSRLVKAIRFPGSPSPFWSGFKANSGLRSLPLL
jgi:hypothetical protein